MKSNALAPWIPKVKFRVTMKVNDATNKQFNFVLIIEGEVK